MVSLMSTNRSLSDKLRPYLFFSVRILHQRKFLAILGLVSTLLILFLHIDYLAHDDSIISSTINTFNSEIPIVLNKIVHNHKIDSNSLTIISQDDVPHKESILPSSLFTSNDNSMDLLDFDREHIKYIYPEVISSIYENTNLDEVDWTKYAYVFYATSQHHMCNTLMMCASLRKYHTRAQMVILVKREFLLQPDEYPYEYKTLTKFAEEYNVILKATEIIQMGGRDGGDDVNIWLSSYTKLMVFNETQYERIIYMDSDALLLRGNMDELFFIPPCAVATSTAYWHMLDRFRDLGSEKIKELYPMEKYGYQRLTTEERKQKLDNFIENNIDPFLDAKYDSKLPFTKHYKRKRDQKLNVINKKNFYTSLYNNLPSYPPVDRFMLTNIVMVIQPTAQLFEKVLQAMRDKKPNEFDMELVQYHVCDFLESLAKQGNNSLELNPDMTYQERLEEKPEFLILPHQVYGTLTQELNMPHGGSNFHGYHSYNTDSHEQLYTHVDNITTSNGERAYYEIDDLPNKGQILYDRVKYLHFSDAPIPKPWWQHDKKAAYWHRRTRCESDPSFNNPEESSPDLITDDCSAGQLWQQSVDLFQKLRKEVCGLDPLEVTQDPYYEAIN